MYILPALLSKCRMPASVPPDSGDKQIKKNSCLSGKAYVTYGRQGLNSRADRLLTFSLTDFFLYPLQ